MKLPNLTDISDLPDEFVLFELDRLEKQIGRLQSRCGIFPEIAPQVEDEEWEKIIADLLNCLPVQSEILVDLPLPRMHRAAIAWQCARVERCIQNVRDLHGMDYDQTPWCLVPAQYRDRIAFVLGSGQVPVAWVAIGDALRF